MYYLIITLGMSVVLFLYSHIIMSQKYREQYQIVFDETNFALNRLLVTGLVILRFHKLPLNNEVISPFERIFWTILFILTFPATFITAVIVMAKGIVKMWRRKR